jgi:hypothetical protein
MALGKNLLGKKSSSASKKVVSLSNSIDLHLSTITDNGELRGMKSLARDKS